jgi:hypothetical protein
VDWVVKAHSKMPKLRSLLVKVSKGMTQGMTQDLDLDYLAAYCTAMAQAGKRVFHELAEIHAPADVLDLLLKVSQPKALTQQNPTKHSLLFSCYFHLYGVYSK